MRFVVATCVALLSGRAWTQSTPEVLTLKDALDSATQHAYSVKIAETNESKQKLILEAARKSLGPKVDLKGNYTRFDQPTFQGPSASIDSKNLQLTVGMAIDIAGISRLNIRVAQFFFEAAHANTAAEINTLRNQVRNAYYGVARAGWLVKIQTENVVNAKARLKVANDKLDQGTLAKFDVIRLETALTQSQSDLVNAKNQVVLAKNSLNLLLARPIETEFEVEPTEVSQMETPDLLACAQLATTNRPEVISGQARISALKNQKKIEGKGMAPGLTVGVTGTHTIDPTPFQRDNSAALGVILTVPLYDSGITKTKTAQAQKDIDTAEIQLAQTKLGISQQVHQAWINLNTAKSVMELADKQITETKEALRIANLLFENAKGILLDVTTSQENYTRALSAHANAHYQWLTAYADLIRAIGSDQIEIPKKMEKEETR